MTIPVFESNWTKMKLETFKQTFQLGWKLDW